MTPKLHILVLFLAILSYSLGKRCITRPYETGLICVCNTTYCDTLEFDPPSAPGEYVIVSSSESGLRFYVDSGKFGQNRHKIEDLLEKTTFEDPQGTEIIVNPALEYQKMVGFGGALTGSVSYLLELINPALKEHIYRSFYSLDEGAAFSMMRTSIGGCDFDLEAWAYNESPENDTNLSNFTKLDDRDLLKVKHIHEIRDTTGNDDIKIIGAAWSSPPWMKTNNAWIGHSALKEEFYQTWADYHLRFLSLMNEQNITFWMISTGNEPINGAYIYAVVPFVNLGWVPATQAAWIAEYLGPTLRNSELSNVKIHAGDDQRFLYPSWFRNMSEANENALDYIDAFGVHWYADESTSPENLDNTHNTWPDKFLLVTESCIGSAPGDFGGPVLGSWERAERYIKLMIQNIQHWVTAWVDWNLVLDEEGGPNYVSNFNSAPIIVNATSGEEFYKDTIYYALGHFSRFISPDSVRISTLSSNSDVQTVGFKRPDGNIALIIWNGNTRSVDVTIRDLTRGHFVLNIPGKSVHSILYQ